MSKSLLAAKIVGGGVLGTGTAVAGGIYIDKHIKSKNEQNTASKETNATLTPSPTDTNLGDQAPSAPQAGTEGNDSKSKGTGQEGSSGSTTVTGSESPGTGK